MKKLLGIATALALVAAVSSFTYVYACGEKKTSADASKAKSSYASSKDYCSPDKEAKAMSDDVKTDNAKVMNADQKVSKASSSCCPSGAKASKVSDTVDNTDKVDPVSKDEVLDISKRAQTEPSVEEIEGKDIMSTSSSSE